MNGSRAIPGYLLKPAFGIPAVTSEDLADSDAELTHTLEVFLGALVLGLDRPRHGLRHRGVERCRLLRVAPLFLDRVRPRPVRAPTRPPRLPRFPDSGATPRYRIGRDRNATRSRGVHRPRGHRISVRAVTARAREGRRVHHPGYAPRPQRPRAFSGRTLPPRPPSPRPSSSCRPLLCPYRESAASRERITPDGLS